jgi:hypothetical protein
MELDIQMYNVLEQGHGLKGLFCPIPWLVIDFR